MNHSWTNRAGEPTWGEAGIGTSAVDGRAVELTGSVTQLKATAELSIVIAVRDNWRQLTSCLDSLAVQEAPPAFEIILIDDGSATPPPPAVAARFDRMRLRRQRQIPLGIAAARNRGISLAKGEVILFVDSDCMCERNCLRNLMKATRYYTSDVVFQLALSSPRASLAERVEGLRLQAVQVSLLLGSGQISYANTSGLAVRSSYARDNEPLFDTALVRGEDTGLLARLLRQSKRPRFLDTCRVLHCPQMPFHRYILKHYWIGYYTGAARRQLQESERVLMNWSRRGQMIRHLWSVSRSHKQRALEVTGAIVCYALERVGRAASRLVGPLSGKHQVLSLHVDAVRQQELITRILTAAEHKQGLWISYANAWTLVQAQRSTAIQRLLNAADLCYPDGLGVGLVSLLLKRRWVSKVTAEDFLFDICSELAERRLSVALVGARREILLAARDKLAKAVPHLKIVVHSPGYLSPAEEKRLIQELVEREPSVILIGMGQPRQEEWLANIKDRLPHTVFWCVGGLFDYLVGPKSSADRARRFGLEWAQKLCRSPRTMSHRYLIGIPALFGYVLIEHAASLRDLFSLCVKSLLPSKLPTYPCPTSEAQAFAAREPVVEHDD